MSGLVLLPGYVDTVEPGVFVMDGVWVRAVGRLGGCDSWGDENVLAYLVGIVGAWIPSIGFLVGHLASGPYSGNSLILWVLTDVWEGGLQFLGW